jgi:peptide/nickel transport system ATP-binding protein
MMPLLDIKNLRTYFKTRGGMVKAVDNISLQLDKGDALGLAGESGCGKTTTALSIMRLLPFNAQILSGKILLNDVDLLKIDDETLRKEIRMKQLSMIFQGAMNALNPVFKVGDQIRQAIITHEDITKDAAWERVRELLSLVGINPNRAVDYPHEFSGGMKQRAIIAMSLACDPELVIADEPVTALDVIVQAQILELIRNLREKLGLSMIMITHDLSVIADTCNKAAIMYAGKIVEMADSVTIFKQPEHPYTQGLIANFPSISGEKKGFEPISGSPPNLISPPTGCRFHPRCPYAEEKCMSEEPDMVEIKGGHYVTCHLEKF